MNHSTAMVQRDIESVPDRYPFVVLRRERFGGYLFNRYLSYTELDAIQTRVLELSEGYLSIRNLTDTIARDFEISPSAAQRHVQTAFDLFDSYCAIHWRSAPKAGEYVLPQMSARENNTGPLVLSAPIYALWDITYACNLKCKHCLTDSGKQIPDTMPLTQVIQILDQLVDLGVFFINFLGGEPFIRKDILEILQYASQKPIGLSVTTNGLLVDDRMLKKLSGLHIFDMQVSIDGLRDTHDAFRGIQGAFDKATQAVKRFSEAGFRTTINTVMTQWNHGQLEELVETALTLGATTFKAVAFLPVGRGKLHYKDLLLTPHQLRENALLLRKLGNRYAGEIKILTEENYPLPSEDPAQCDSACFPNMGCAAGITQLVIDPTGQVFACPFLHNLLAGDLRQQSLAEIWEQSEVFNTFRNIEKSRLKGHCHDCQYAPGKCRGGCRAAAYAVTGDLWAEDPLCWHAHC